MENDEILNFFLGENDETSEYSILPITRTSKGPMKMVRVNECSSYPG